MKEVLMVKLNAGQRYLLKDENVFVQLLEGSCEIYAVTRKDTKISYRQTYLLDLYLSKLHFLHLMSLNRWMF